MKNLVLITSVICIENKPLSYTNVRSIYSHQERFEQTKKTIETIREKIPNAKIFVVPLLVWNVSSMNQEQNSSYNNIPATTIPYWNESCGEYFIIKKN
jgi:hypothetical protein